ncbi:MAG: DUF4387 family protein [Gammaproteobacteria bacterium]|nr:DUF4387 family protein [Gammaproteobacteria bacterium]
MKTIGDYAKLIRSKNAGPFWLSVDIFAEAQYAVLCNRLDNQKIAEAFKVPPDSLKRFDLDDLRVIKLSLPRPVVQGATADRDQHGAQYAHLVSALGLLPDGDR